MAPRAPGFAWFGSRGASWFDSRVGLGTIRADRETDVIKSALLKKAPAGTFESLYKRHAQDVYRYCRAMLGRQADAEDATQTTFLNAYRALERGETPRDARSWLQAIALNVCREHYRSAGRRPEEVSLDDDPGELVSRTPRPRARRRRQRPLLPAVQPARGTRDARVRGPVAHRGRRRPGGVHLRRRGSAVPRAPCAARAARGEADLPRRRAGDLAPARRRAGPPRTGTAPRASAGMRRLRRPGPSSQGPAVRDPLARIPPPARVPAVQQAARGRGGLGVGDSRRARGWFALPDARRVDRGEARDRGAGGRGCGRHRLQDAGQPTSSVRRRRRGWPLGPPVRRSRPCGPRRSGGPCLSCPRARLCDPNPGEARRRSRRQDVARRRERAPRTRPPHRRGRLVRAPPATHWGREPPRAMGTARATATSRGKRTATARGTGKGRGTGTSQGNGNATKTTPASHGNQKPFKGNGNAYGRSRPKTKPPTAAQPTSSPPAIPPGQLKPKHNNGKG